MPPALAFRRASRILRSREFGEIRRRGGRAQARSAIMNWHAPGDRACSRLGLVAGKKQAGNRAVDRNRARRLLREAFRRMQPRISPPADIVLIARKGIGRRRQIDVDRDLAGLLRRAGLLERSA